MALKTVASTLAFLSGSAGSLLLIGVGLWAWRRTKSRCLPWIVAYCILNSPLLSLCNSWVVNYLLGVSSKSNSVSLSTWDIFSKMSAIAEYMNLQYLFSCLGFFAIALLIAAEATFLIHQWKPIANDRLPRFFGLIIKFSPVVGLAALGFAIVSHLMLLMAPYISP